MLFYKRVGPKLRKVEYDVPILTPYKREWHDRIVDLIGAPVQLPDPNAERTWTLVKPWSGKIYHESGIIEVNAKIGWNIDFASIPEIAESLEKRDDREGLIPAFFHDGFFEAQYPAFEISNDLYHQLNRYFGMGFWRAWRRRVGVQSKFGYEAWLDSSNPENVDYGRKWLSVKEYPYKNVFDMPLK